jgi:hypothetical protein
MPETDLYLPIKRHLEAQGYTVKSEIRSCDVVAVRGDEPLLIVELKTSFNLNLIFQAMDRLMMTEHVYVAVARPKRGLASSALKLCRRVGVGFIVVSSAGSVEVMADPVPYQPRLNTRKRGLLLKEFNARKGDPNVGGSTRKPLMTAYRQDAMKCAEHLQSIGPSRVRDVKASTGVERAAAILRDNVYGWFVKVERGVYGVASDTFSSHTTATPSLAS